MTDTSTDAAAAAGTPADETPAPAASPVVHLTAETFDEEVASSAVPLLVDFWAEWCYPCKMIAPILEEIAAEHAGKIRIGKLDTDNAPEIARRFDILSIPTLILFMDGEPQLRLRGARGKGSLLEELQEYL